MRHAIKRFITSSFIICALIFSGVSNAGETLQRVVDFKVLKVGMSGAQPPMNTVNRDGAMMGMDVDLARALASAMNVTLEIKIMPFGELLGALEKDEVDMVISGMSITPERTERVSFIGPYMMSGKSILTKDSVLAKISSEKEVNRDNLTFVALKNSTSAAFVRNAAPRATLVEIDAYDEGVAMVKDGKADGLVADMPICVLSVMRYPDAGFVTLENPLTVEPVGIAISKDDPQLLNLVQNYLDAYGKLGVLNQLRKKWFENNEWIAALP
tara:strand:+ start:32105 stop:32914 length:810 start_codon:yes stop_codon:yes gene_type:complete